MAIRNLETMYYNRANGIQVRLVFVWREGKWQAEFSTRRDFRYPVQAREWVYRGIIFEASNIDLISTLEVADNYICNNFDVHQIAA